MSEHKEIINLRGFNKSIKHSKSLNLPPSCWCFLWCTANYYVKLNKHASFSLYVPTAGIISSGRDFFPLHMKGSWTHLDFHLLNEPLGHRLYCRVSRPSVLQKWAQLLIFIYRIWWEQTVMRLKVTQWLVNSNN